MVIPELRSEPSVQVDKKCIDVRTIGECIFALGGALTKNKEVTEITIPLYFEYDKMSDLLRELILFLYLKDVTVKVEKNPQKTLFDFDKNLADDYSCLFSGGIDSFSGILSAKNHYNPHKIHACFTFHPDLKMARLIEKLYKISLQKHGILYREIRSQRHLYYNRVSRGFLYVMNSFILGNKNLIIPECGVTMHQPKFTVLDEVTMTTHPQVLSYAKLVLDEIFGNQTQIITPNENLTKSEIASSCVDKKNLISTCSCLTTRWCNSAQPNCGVCYGCVIRKIGMIVAGIDDSKKYRVDIFSDKDFSSTRLDNLTNVVQFAADFLNYEEQMPFYTSDIITKYHKADLFRRFAKDVFASLMLHKKCGSKNRFILKMYEKHRMIFSEEELENRIEEVRTCKFKPNYV